MAKKQNTTIRPEIDRDEPGQSATKAPKRVARGGKRTPAAQSGHSRIGEYLLRDPDYRQILRWAEELGMAPEVVLATLAETQLEPSKGFAPIGLSVEDGAIVSLAWDFERLAIVPANWEPGLLIHTLGFRGEWPDAAIALRPMLPKLQVLACPSLGLESLDLSQVPELASLYCGSNQLTELDLSPVPKLTELLCSNNPLTVLNLSPVPKLTRLGCNSNQLTALDLSPVPKLTGLVCHSNQLTVLDLSPVPELTKLACDSNQLTVLDLSPVPELTELLCSDNQLTVLDISPVPELTVLDCQSNQLTALDLSPVPKLTKLACRNNQFTTLDISHAPGLTHIDYDKSNVTILNGQASAGVLTLQQFRQIVKGLPKMNQKELDQAAPGWRSLVKDPANYQALLQFKPQRDRDDLMVLFVETVGLDLANVWASLSDSDAKNAAIRWLKANINLFSQFSIDGKNAFINNNSINFLIREMTIEIWHHLSPKKRNEILRVIWSNCQSHAYIKIMSAFSLYLHGAPFVEYRQVMDSLEYDYRYDFDDYWWFRHHYRHYRDFPDNTLAPQDLVQALRHPFQISGLLCDPTSIDEVAALLQIIRDAGDTQSLDRWEQLRNQYTAMTAGLPNALTPDTYLTNDIPTPIKTWLQAKQHLLTPGAALPPWPEVIVSDEDPPLFKIHPFYKRMYEEDYLGGSWHRGAERDRDRERGRERNPERIFIEGRHADTELLLGCYEWRTKRITLWRKGIELCAAGLSHANGRGVPIEDLTRCVLIHELGHWFNAEAIAPRHVAWDPAPLTLTAKTRLEECGPLDPYDLGQPSPPVLTGDARSLSSRSYHEAWAQLFAWLYGQEQEPGILTAFEALEARQSAPYQAWRYLVSAQPATGSVSYTINDLRWPQPHILASLAWSRSRRDPATGAAQPATFDDANFPRTNMLVWL